MIDIVIGLICTGLLIWAIYGFAKFFIKEYTSRKKFDEECRIRHEVERQVEEQMKKFKEEQMKK